MATTNPAEPSAVEPFRNWHRLFGLMLSTHLAGSPFTVETERDLSTRRQFLDVVIVRRGSGKLVLPMPDGLDDFVDHNLLTFKSFREPLDDWTLKELTGHYVNYRKEVSPRDALLAEDLFRLYAVCARTPRDLFNLVPVVEVRPGVYHCRRGTDCIRIVVAAELPLTERNSLLHLFSAAKDRIQYGQEHYQLRTRTVSTIVSQLYESYGAEGIPMPYTMEDLEKEITIKNLGKLTPEERLRGMKPEEMLEQLTPAQIEAYLGRLRQDSPAPRKKKPKPKR